MENKVTKTDKRRITSFNQARELTAQELEEVSGAGPRGTHNTLGGTGGCKGKRDDCLDQG